MKALTICQPYAHLICVTKQKSVENRSWPTGYRGPLAIHAGKSLDWLTLDYDDAGCEYDTEYNVHIDSMAFGAVVGAARLIDCLHIDTIQSKQVASLYPWLQDHVHATGPWCWVLQECREFEKPIPWRGAQGLWTLPDSAMEGVSCVG